MNADNIQLFQLIAVIWIFIWLKWANLHFKKFLIDYHYCIKISWNRKLTIWSIIKLTTKIIGLELEIIATGIFKRMIGFNLLIYFFIVILQMQSIVNYNVKFMDVKFHPLKNLRVVLIWVYKHIHAYTYTFMHVSITLPVSVFICENNWVNF